MDRATANIAEDGFTLALVESLLHLIQMQFNALGMKMVGATDGIVVMPQRLFFVPAVTD